MVPHQKNIYISQSLLPVNHKGSFFFFFLKLRIIFLALRDRLTGAEIQTSKMIRKNGKNVKETVRSRGNYLLNCLGGGRSIRSLN